jgi:hypothetical protein
MRATRSSILAVFTAAFLAAPAAVHAGDTYLALKGGVWAPTASNGFSAASDVLTTGKFPTSGDIELAYGATLGIIGAQISAGYMWTSQVIDGVTVKANGIPLTAVGQLRLPIFFIQPYLEAGIGVFTNFGSASGGGVTLSATKFSFMVVGGAGVDFFLGPILLGAEARYNYMTDQTFDWGTMKLSGVTITANVGYIF